MANLECCGNSYCGKAKTPLMPGSGNKKAKIMILGEAPGAEEDEAGKPFVGKAGRFLRTHILRGVGLNDSNVYFQNAVRCYPGRSKDGKKNKNPLANDIRKCRYNLENEVKRVKPKVIIAMGNVALHACLELARWRNDDGQKETQVTGITRWRGKLVWHSEFNCWIMFTYHPSYLMRKYKFEKYEFDQTILDFERAITAVNRPQRESSLNGMAILGNRDLALSYIRQLFNHDEIAVDTETSTMDFKELMQIKPDSPLLGVSFSTGDNAISLKSGKRVVPVRGAYIPSRVLFDTSVISMFQDLMHSSSVRKLWHNLGFDEKVLYAVGITFGNTVQYNHVCTMMAAKLLDENFSVGLKELTWRHLGFGGYERQMDHYRRENKIISFADVPEKMLARYAAIDPYATFKLWEKVFKPGLEKDGILDFFLKTLCQTRRVFTSFEIDGMRVDVKRAKALSKKCAKVRKELERQLYKVAGRQFKMKSYPQIRRILYKELGAKPLKETKTGAASTDGETMRELLKLKTTPPRAKKFIQIRSDIAYIDKQVSTYIDRVVKLVWSDDRVRISYNLTGTVTGRPSSSLSNIPKDGLIRSLFIASEGNVLMECDMAAAELRVLAAYCKEPVMVKAFRNDEDLHEATARAIFNLSRSDEVSKPQRDIGKRVNFGSVYGISAKGLSDKFGVTEKEAEEFLLLYFQNMPRVGKWLESNAKFGRKHGYVVSFFGRKRRVPELRSDSRGDQSRARRQANNSVIQSCASDICYKGMVRTFQLMERNRMRGRIVNSVYDSVLFDLPKSEVKKMQKIARVAFESPIKLKGVPDFYMKVDFKVAERWGADYPSKLSEVLLMKPYDQRKAA